MTLHCLIPAAGAASRMRGADKLLEEVEGAPCLRVMAQRALEAGLDVIVTLPSADHPRAEALKGLDVETLVVPNAANGMSASLVAGAQAVPKSSAGLMVLLADMPALKTEDLSAMAEGFAEQPSMILRARSASKQPGHPIIFPSALLSAFWHLTGDSGAQRLIQRHAEHLRYFDVDDERVCLDLDTPEAWAAWRASLAEKH